MGVSQGSPLIVQVVSAAASERSPEHEWLVLLQQEGADVIFSQIGHNTLQRQSLAQLQPRLTGIALRVTAVAPAVNDPDSVGRGTRAFGFSWFVPELLKHKHIWRDVLLASLVLQLIALAFPLFTQAIIDKVVVHRTQSTLIALAVGMCVFIVFTTILTWVRQYLILHTGNRVDAVLGSTVFEHLFKLPPLYFQHPSHGRDCREAAGRRDHP